jgi:hypothetical protein
MTTFPGIFRLRQTFDVAHIEDVPAEVHSQLARLDLGKKIRAGQTVAITAGSRGIANVAAITRAIVENLESLGARPFIVPAMGSHGGGTADGQRQLLESLGITEQSVGCPIRSSTETVVVGSLSCGAAVSAAPAGGTPAPQFALGDCPDFRAGENGLVPFAPGQGFPLHFDRLAFEADHVLICNRVKPHTSFAGPIESGLLKMLTIGLGNPEGATTYHRAMLDFGFDRIVRRAAAEVLARGRILAGVAVVENAYDQTARIEAVPPASAPNHTFPIRVLTDRIANLLFEKDASDSTAWPVQRTQVTASCIVKGRIGCQGIRLRLCILFRKALSDV